MVPKALFKSVFDLYKPILVDREVLWNLSLAPSPDDVGKSEHSVGNGGRSYWV